MASFDTLASVKVWYSLHTSLLDTLGVDLKHSRPVSKNLKFRPSTHLYASGSGSSNVLEAVDRHNTLRLRRPLACTRSSEVADLVVSRATDRANGMAFRGQASDRSGHG